MLFSIKRAVLPVVAVGVFFLGCSPAPVDLTVFVSGDTRGYLEQCGCRVDQAGGLPTRAHFVRKVEPAGRVVVDVGNLTAGGQKYELLKLKYILEAMKLIGYDAVNIGAKEAELDLEVLSEVVKSSPVPFVSANVVRRKDDRPIAEPFRVFTRQGRRIGVIGVTSCDPMDVGPGLKVRPPVEALAETIPIVRKSCDYLVVLAFVNEDTLRDIASKFFEIDCILGGDVPQSSDLAQTLNRATVFNVTGKGKVIGRIDLTCTGQETALKSSVGLKVASKSPPPSDLARLIDRYKGELKERRFELASVEGMERINSQEGTADEFKGAKACLDCHADSHKKWDASAHAKAFATLQRVKSDFDPECLKCHTVGYGLASGFVDQATTPELAGVQCESCHGRGKDHMATQSKKTLKPVTPASCVRCHDAENSENFRYATFWPKIAH